MKTFLCCNRNPKQGNALLLVLLLCTFMLILLGSYLVTLSVNSKIANRSNLHNQARNAAQGVAEFAVAEIYRRCNSFNSFGSSINPSPIGTYSALTSNQQNYLASGTNIDPTSLQFKCSNLSTAPSTPPKLLPSSDPINLGDPEMAKAPVAVRTAMLHSKATVQDPVTGNRITSYIQTYLRITDQTWLNYAIFYNTDLEMHAGAKFVVTGPVHTNGNAYLTAWYDINNPSLNELYFQNVLQANGKINQYIRYDKSHSYGQTAGVYVDSLTKGAHFQMYNNLSGSANDSNGATPINGNPDWTGKVFDGVDKFNPPGMQIYTESTLSSVGTTATTLRNNAYLMIEPQLSNTEGFKTGIAPSGNIVNLEDMKFSGLSSFVVQVFPPTAPGLQPTWHLVQYQATDSNYPLSKDNPPLRASCGKPIIKMVIDPFADTDSVSNPSDPKISLDMTRFPDYLTSEVPANYAYISRELRVALLKTFVSVPYLDNGGGTYGTGSTSADLQRFKQDNQVGAGSTKTIKCKSSNLTWNSGGSTYIFNDVNPSTSASDNYLNPRLATSGQYFDPHYYPVYDRREGYSYSSGDHGGATNHQTNGLRGAFHTLIVDMAQLNHLLHTQSLWYKPGTTTPIYDATKDYTGIVYVELPLANAENWRFPTGYAIVDRDGTTQAGIGPADADKVRHAIQPTTTTPGYAVLIRNAGGGDGGNPGFLPQCPNTDIDGFTFATNGPVYVWGNYNSDGKCPTKSDMSNVTDGNWKTSYFDAGGKAIDGVEIPALIAGDSVTALAATKNNDAGYDFPYMTRYATTQKVASGRPSVSPNGGYAAVEISAAVLTGLVPTRPGHELCWSGGVHNLIRFLQNFQNSTWTAKEPFGYRGSLIALYESEVASQPYRDDGIFLYWFNGPDLFMGYHQFFAQGRFPPGLPIFRQVRRLGIKEIKESDYNTGPTTPWAYF